MKRVKVLIPVIILTVFIIILIILLNPSKRYQKLFINESKWESLQESKTSNDNLKLERIEFNEYNLVIDEASDTIYYSIVNDNQTKYNPNVSFESNEDNVKLAILEDEITDEKVHSDYSFKLMIYNKQYYHIYNLVCTDFPIVNIVYDTNTDIEKTKNIDVDISVFDNMEQSGKRITNSKGELDIQEIDGKKEYKLKLTTVSPGRNERKNHLSIFSMDPHNEYLLTKENEIPVDNPIDAPRDFKVELFINNEYQGQYSIKNGKGNIPKPLNDDSQQK